MVVERSVLTEINEDVMMLCYVRYMWSCVRLSSVCLSVTFVHPTQAIEIFGIIFISYERSFILVFLEEEWLVGATPST